MGETGIKLFSLSTCSHCKAVKELLSRHAVEAEVIDVDRLTGDRRKAVIETVKGYNERVSFPTIVIGGEVIVGYKADRIRKALRKTGTPDAPPPSSPLNGQPGGDNED